MSQLAVALAVAVAVALVVLPSDATASPGANATADGAAGVSASGSTSGSASGSTSASGAPDPLRAGGPGNYYAQINTNLNGTAFQSALHALIRPHTVLTYNALWGAFRALQTDTDGCSGAYIDDIYSSKCWTPGTEQCGNYKAEGDCYNREHSWPKSWWGGAQLPAYTDLFHLFPSDGYDNARRSNYALGDVSAAAYTTDSGCKLGACAAGDGDGDSEFSGTCWEPSDETKGLLARAYFYMSTAYMGEWTCCDTDGTDAARIKPWMLNQLRRWHASFPPTAAEQRRNDLVFSEFQGNRNPFIDHPQWADKIDFTVSGPATDDAGDEDAQARAAHGQRQHQRQQPRGARHNRRNRRDKRQ